MTLWKRIKRLWTLLTTEEVFDGYGSRGGRDPIREPGSLSILDENLARKSQTIVSRIARADESVPTVRKVHGSTAEHPASTS